MALTIIRGLPGSGKSTYAKNNFGGALVLEGDQRFVDVDGKYAWDPTINDRAYLTDMIEMAFKHNLKHVIVTTSSSHVKSIQQLVDAAKKYGHETRVMWLDYLNGEGLNGHSVKPDVIARMKYSWQLYPGETYARRVADGYGSHFTQFSIKLVDTPPPWYTETHKAKKIIFLDVDGVLNTAFEVNPGEEFNPKMMEQLKQLVDNTGADIVLSSTWGYTKETQWQVGNALSKYDIKLYANIYQYSQTVFMEGELTDKDVAIPKWLSYHPEVTHYVVLDDYDYSRAFPDNLIRTFDPANKRYGLDDGFRLEAEKILNKDAQHD